MGTKTGHEEEIPMAPPLVPADGAIPPVSKPVAAGVEFSELQDVKLKRVAPPHSNKPAAPVPGSAVAQILQRRAAIDGDELDDEPKGSQYEDVQTDASAHNPTNSTHESPRPNNEALMAQIRQGGVKLRSAAHNAANNAPVSKRDVPTPPHNESTTKFLQRAQAYAQTPKQAKKGADDWDEEVSVAANKPSTVTAAVTHNSSVTSTEGDIESPAPVSTEVSVPMPSSISSKESSADQNSNAEKQQVRGQNLISKILNNKRGIQEQYEKKGNFFNFLKKQHKDRKSQIEAIQEKKDFLFSAGDNQSTEAALNQYTALLKSVQKRILEAQNNSFFSKVLVKIGFKSRLAGVIQDELEQCSALLKDNESEKKPGL